MRNRSIILSLAIVLFGCVLNKEDPDTNSRFHVFYYNWYGDPEIDGAYYHWAHDILPHWSDTTWDDAGRYEGGENIGANFYPSLGCYSSNDTTLVRTHMTMIKDAGVGVVALTWWGEGSYEDRSIPIYLEEAENAGIKITLHLEPFYSSIEELIRQLDYIETKYGKHPALYKQSGRPFFYVYDSYKLRAQEWARMLSDTGDLSIRDTQLDGTFIGLWVEKDEHEFFLRSGFDGFYTYFASNGFVHGSTTDNWSEMSIWAKNNQLIFVPCIGPGYSDTRIRPWNSGNSKDRMEGEYYRDMFEAAIAASPQFIGITSFNEWHEGTQIEPSTPKSNSEFKYEDFGDLEEDHYLKMTKNFSAQFNMEE